MYQSLCVWNNSFSAVMNLRTEYHVISFYLSNINSFLELILRLIWLVYKWYVCEILKFKLVYFFISLTFKRVFKNINFFNITIHPLYSDLSFLSISHNDESLEIYAQAQLINMINLLRTLRINIKCKNIHVNHAKYPLNL